MENGVLVHHTKTAEEIRYEEALAEAQRIREHDEPILNEINQYKKLLADSDYKCLKFVDGELSQEEYSAIQQSRHEWRVKINELESTLLAPAKAEE